MQNGEEREEKTDEQLLEEVSADRELRTLLIYSSVWEGHNVRGGV